MQQRSDSLNTGSCSSNFEMALTGHLISQIGVCMVRRETQARCLLHTCLAVCVGLVGRRQQNSQKASQRPGSQIIRCLAGKSQVTLDL